ncbi:MAG TPA: hypothetical protein VI258_12910 [Rhodanobacteraceae bacterium]
MTEAEQRPPPRAGTDWPAIFTSSLVPLTVAAGFAWFALDPSEAGDWARGLLALIPLEYFRALVLYILRDTYREYRSPMRAVRFFLLSLAILIVIALAISLYVLKGDWWAWITKPEVYRAIALALALIAVDGVIGVYFFRGNPRQLSARLDAIADDARDWVQLGAFQLPIVLALALGFLFILRETGHVPAWVPEASLETLQSAGLFYAAFYFVGKAMLIAHAYTAAFHETGRRLLGGSVVQWLIWEKNKNSEVAASSERAAANRRRAVLMGGADN